MRRDPAERIGTRASLRYNGLVIARTPLLTLLLLTAVFPAYPQCTLAPVYDGAYRGTALDTALDGDDLWVATSWGLALYAAAFDPPRPVTTIVLPGTTSSVTTSSGNVYVGSGSKVYVVRNEGGEPVVIGSVAAGGTVSDLLVVSSYVFAATSVGVVQIDVIVPDRPATVRTLSTTNGHALSLAQMGGTMYASDGDSTVEIYNIQVPSIPQKIGTLNSLLRSLWVSEASGLLFVSDGQQTEVFGGSGVQVSRISTLAAGGNGVLAGSGSVVWLAGDDRILRAFEVTTTTSPAKLFASTTAPLGGTVNRFLELTGRDGRIYGAAGDADLSSFDTRGFIAPYPLRGYAFGQASSAISLGSSIVTSLTSGGLFKYSLSSSGALTLQTNWDVGAVSIVRDGSGSRVLTSAGSRARLWDVAQNPPVELSSVTLRTAIVSAVLNGSGGVAVLADQSAWSLDFTNAQGVSTQLSLGGAKPVMVERGGTDIVFADFGEDGATTLRYYSGGNLTAAPAVATIEGATTSGLGVSGTGRVAGVTFKGISVVDFSTGGSVATYPGTNSVIARDVHMSGAALFVLTSSTLQYWDTGSRALRATVALDTTGATVHAASGSSSAIVATAEGVSTVQYLSSSQSPVTLKAGSSNRYYREVSAGDRLLHLFDGRSVDTFALDSTGLPGPPRSLTLSGSIIDVAPVGQTLYVLAGTGLVTGYSPAATVVSSYQINEAGDQRMVSMRAVAGALWVTVEAGCLSGACELRTLVLDPRAALTKSSTITGGAVAATAEGSRAWAIFTVPSEIRVYDVSDPYRPAQLAQRASTGNPVAIARDSVRTAVYALGERLYAYTDSQLAELGAQLDPYVSDPSGRVGYIDQQILVSGECALVTGRSFNPRPFRIVSATNWVEGAVPGSAAAAVRSSVVVAGKTYLLSDYSLEILSSTTPVPIRRRPVR